MLSQQGLFLLITCLQFCSNLCVDVCIIMIGLPLSHLFPFPPVSLSTCFPFHLFPFPPVSLSPLLTHPYHFQAFAVYTY
ncbi:hypothetical protein B0T26DRAFT_367571 [Lasiosphaeria miniovina]|uniref:Uncharacterized protein n=1 Tax=Lasiosphaeria miniovina TaxID=1954250 RepID=A0AA40AD44_9PEZI|nr:uncharacterized protein B0T26DRAFT_367571 [Lasiosphaeria miniovina]KAK0713625.1 hypothetical protein B0T26DRAFT_367571 [Lasiosphaeria miniovina]